MNIETKLKHQSLYQDVLGDSMHYLKAGQGDPVVFIHGIPTWSYMWRNVIPFLSDKATCIAPDLIGMGRSAKPKIEYTIFDHIRYFDVFMEALGLSNVTLVMHAWGAVIGFDYAMRHPQRIKGLAFFETPHVRPLVERDMLSLPIQELTTVLNTPDQGRDMILNSNYYVDRVLLGGVLRPLQEEEWRFYREPFKTPADRQLIWQFLHEYPKGDHDENLVIDLIANYSQALQQSNLPKLLLYAVPGFVTPISSVEWAQQHLPNLIVEEIGEALHLIPESKPDVLGQALRTWIASI